MDVQLECDEFLNMPPFKINEIVSKSMDFNDFMLKKKQTIDDAIKNKKIAVTPTSSKPRNEQLGFHIEVSESKEPSSPDSNSTLDHSYPFKNTVLQSTSTPVKDPKVPKSPATVNEKKKTTPNVNIKKSPALIINELKAPKNVDENQLLVVGQKLTNAIEVTSKFISTGKCVVCFTPVNETNSIQTNVNTQSFTEFGFILKLILGLSKCELQSNLCCTSCSSRVMHTFNDWLDINVLALLKDDVKSYKHRICEDCKFSLPTLESFTDHLFSHIITGKPLKTKVVFKVKVKKDDFKGQTPPTYKNPKLGINGIPTRKSNNKDLNPISQNIKKPKNANQKYSSYNLGDKNKVKVASPNGTNTVLSANMIRPSKPLRYIAPKVESDVVVIGEKKYTVGKLSKNIPENSGKTPSSPIIVHNNKFNTILKLDQPNTRPKILLPLKNSIRVTSRGNNKFEINSGFIRLVKGTFVKSKVVIDVEEDSIPDQNSVKASEKMLGLNSGDVSKSDNVIESVSGEIPNRDNVAISEGLNFETVVAVSGKEIPDQDNDMIGEVISNPDSDKMGEKIPKLNSGDDSKPDNAMESEDGDIPKPDNVMISEEIPELNSDTVVAGGGKEILDQDNDTISKEIPELNSDTVMAGGKEIQDQDDDTISEEIPGLNSDIVMAGGKEIPDQDNDTISDEILGLSTDIVMASDGEEIPDQENVTILNKNHMSNFETTSSAIMENEEVSDNVMDIDEIPTLNSDNTEVEIPNSHDDIYSNIVVESNDLPEMNIVPEDTELVEEIITNDNDANRSAEEIPMTD